MAGSETSERAEALQAEVTRLRAELNLTEQRLAFATSSARLAWWDWDIHTGRLSSFGAQPGFLGFGPEDTPMTAQSWYSRVHPDDLPAAGTPSPLQLGASEWSEEMRVRGDDGSCSERVRRFNEKRDFDILSAGSSRPGCALCDARRYDGRGDMNPFLDQAP